MEDRDVVRAFLETDPIATSTVWDRVYQQPAYTDVRLDGLPPKAVLAMSPGRPGRGPAGIALHATDVAAARDLVGAIPAGPVFMHLTQEWALALLELRAAELQARPAWLHALDPKDFVELQRHEVRPVDPAWAGRIAQLWEPDWPSEAYVRRRIEAGPSAAVVVDGEPVAWAMTHHETPWVGMMGFLHVVEEHRGKGYAKSVGSALAKEILRRGKVPALHVYADNVPSLRLSEKLGFHRVTRQVWGDAVLR